MNTIYLFSVLFFIICRVSDVDSGAAAPAADGAGSSGAASGSPPAAAVQQLFIKQGRNLRQALPYEPLLRVHVDGQDTTHTVTLV